MASPQWKWEDQIKEDLKAEKYKLGDLLTNWAESELSPEEYEQMKRWCLENLPFKMKEYRLCEYLGRNYSWDDE